MPIRRFLINQGLSPTIDFIIPQAFPMQFQTSPDLSHKSVESPPSSVTDMEYCRHPIHFYLFNFCKRSSSLPMFRDSFERSNVSLAREADHVPDIKTLILESPTLIYNLSVQRLSANNKKNQY